MTQPKPRSRPDLVTSPAYSRLGPVLTVYGVTVLTFMMLMYALEARGRGFVLAFAAGCALSSSYGFLAGTWPFGVVELVWAAVALQKFARLGPDDGGGPRR